MPCFVRSLQVVVKAHTSSLDRMQAHGEHIVTSSKLGTIRMWGARDLADEARRQGILHTAPSTSSLAAAGSMAMGRKGSAGHGELRCRGLCLRAWRAGHGHGHTARDPVIDLRGELTPGPPMRPCMHACWQRLLQ